MSCSADFGETHRQELASLKLRENERLAALCISGGGIRSATFALGVIQGLAKRGYLDKFHYLSTVSGGGYVGGWLSAWIHRAGIKEVVAALKEPEPEDPVNWLRSYSNYLAPKLGLLSADTWTIAAIYLRNLVLNWMILVPLLMAAVMVSRAGVLIVTSLDKTPKEVYWGMVVLGFVAGAYGVSSIGRYMDQRGSGWDVAREPVIVLHHVAPVVFASAMFSGSWYYIARQFEWQSGVGLLLMMAFGMVLHAAGWLWSFVRTHWQPKRFDASIFAVLVTGALGGAFVWVAYTRFVWPLDVNPILYITISMPVLLGQLMLAGVIFVGVASSPLLRRNTGAEGYLSDLQREWWARSGAWIMIMAFAWALFASVSLYGPRLLLDSTNWLWAASGGSLSGLLATWIGWTASSTGKGESQDGKKGSALTKLGEGLLAPLFAIFLIVLLSMAITAAGLGYWPMSTADHLHHLSHMSELWGKEQLFYGLPGAKILRVIFGAWTIWSILFLAGLGSLACAMFSVNRFSLFYFYRNRLIRAYLGASNPDRLQTLNPFTGFSDTDNLPLAKLRGQRPIPILNVALNITGGHRLAWQTRKAASFSVSPYHVGSWLQLPETRTELGFRSTDAYTDGGLSLGAAMALSGAAASPNMGYHTSTVLSFLLTFFNMRLGAWLPNPASCNEPIFRKSGPSDPKVLFDELLGATDERSDWVYLSDGGHFENLGLYEMVKRRCRLIVLSDAAGDPKYTLDDLGNAIHKIRVDLNAQIEFVTEPKFAREDGQHAALLRIRYPDGSEGLILYLKPAISQALSVDVKSYAATDPNFPQQSTGDQFFDEGQFEAYRQLGEQTLNWAADGAIRGDLDELFVSFRRRLQPDLPQISSAEAGGG